MRFYFDVVDGEEAVEDTEGVELSGRRAARDEAVARLHRLAPEPLRDRDTRTIVIRVRTEGGAPVLAVGLMATISYGA
jgi:hypothetical protein